MSVANVLADANTVVDDAVLATRVATPVPSLKVYNPKRIRDAPVVRVRAEATLIELTVAPHIGEKKVK
jgi:hypothetical protein